MNMIRTFHSVGQGAFYSEDFENFKIVYDCGSYKNKSLIEDEITTSFDESETIDALFISHLHEDHINGVPYLLKRNKVKYIFLPFLTSAEKLLLLTYNTLQNQSSPFTEQLIINPLQLSEEYEVKFVFVMPNEGEDTTADDSVINITDNINFPGSLKSGTKIKIGKMDWLFIPFHFQRKKKTALFQKLITENNLKLNTPDDFSAILKDKKQFSLLENCYREIPGSLNSNSLVLYSGPEKGDRFHTRDFPQNRWFHPIYHHIGSGCIYFGDYDAHGKLK